MDNQVDISADNQTDNMANNQADNQMLGIKDASEQKLCLFKKHKRKKRCKKGGIYSLLRVGSRNHHICWWSKMKHIGIV